MPALAASATRDLTPPSVKVDGDDAPVKRIDPDALRTLGQNLNRQFDQYKSDRRIAELRWLRNQRQYLGIYDPDIEEKLSPNRSKAYPKITRVKCISVLSRLMNLMFPGNERNWELRASPSPSMSMEDVTSAVQTAQGKDQAAGVQSQVDVAYITSAVKQLADDRAEQLSLTIDDQLQELGGDQTYDYVALNREVLMSGVTYGLGVLRGPFVKECKSTTWAIDPTTGQAAPQEQTIYKPLFEFLSVWDFYPDLAAKTFSQMDGYYVRMVMSRSQVRKLGKRPDFFEDVIKRYLERTPNGNYKAQLHEMELRTMGVKVNVNEQKADANKYEVVAWHGPVSGMALQQAGVQVPENKLSDEVDAEVWMIDGNVIKATMNPWAMLDVDVKTLHPFLFDKDDTSPLGQGLPNVIRDSQMSISAATRMLLDNASVTCGPNLELNTELLRPDQDLSSTSAYKVWYREGLGPEAQFPAVRNVQIDSHMDELLKVIELFMKFADTETFVGPSTGGDMAQAPSEPMRTAAGASMLRGDAALPFKDIVRSFDQFTQSVIESLVQFNRKFNPELAPEGDYNVVARGATSLIAKEVRGMQVDQLAQTLRPEEMQHIDERKLIEARIKVRDLGDLLLPVSEVARRQAAAAQDQQKQQQMQQEAMEAEIRKTFSEAFKNIAQGQKNTAAADAASVNAALSLLEKGVMDVNANSNPDGGSTPQNGGDQAGGGATSQA
jgi:hypothetical protein